MGVYSLHIFVHNMCTGWQTAVTLQIALINVYFLPDDEISFSSSLWGYLRDCGYNGFRLRLGVWDSWKCGIPYLSNKGRLCDYFLRGRATTSHKEIAWYIYCPSNRRLLVPDISCFNGRIVCHFLWGRLPTTPAGGFAQKETSSRQLLFMHIYPSCLCTCVLHT